MTKSLTRSIDLKIKSNTYSIEYPNTGQQLDIELMKAKMTDGNYETLRFGVSVLFQEQANKIDMIATFSILIPELKDNLSVRSFFHLSEEESNELLTVYTEQFLPWYEPIKLAIRNPKDFNEKA
jgi:hypothetical protein